MLLNLLTHLLMNDKSFPGLTRRGNSAARWGTRITPIYMDEFLGDKSRLMSIRGVPFTFNNLSNSDVSSSVGDSSSPSNIEFKAGDEGS